MLLAQIAFYTAAFLLVAVGICRVAFLVIGIVVIYATRT